MLRLNRFQPPVRRVLAVDAGSRRLRLLLVQGRFGQAEVLREESLDLHEEGLVATEELQAHLASVRSACGDPPVVLALPQHLSVSQTVELESAPDNEVRKLIEGEIRQLAGVSDSAIVHDYAAVHTPAPGRQQYWVTFCRQDDIEERIRQLGLEADDLCEVTTTANALAIASEAAARLKNAIVIHLGAQSTVVLMLSGGQAIYAASFPVGGDSFTRVIAKAQKCAPEVAETARCNEDLLSAPDPLAPLAEFVQGWAAELKRQIKDAFAHHRGGAGAGEFAIVAHGTGFNQPGLLDYLSQHAGLQLQRWPHRAGKPSPGFEIAYGAALQALGLAEHPVSLLPAPRRAAWQRRQSAQLVEFASVALLALCFLALAFGMWQKTSLLRQQQGLLVKADAALESLTSNRALTTELMAEYDRLRPLLERQQHTTDTLATMELLRHSRSNRSFWFVLIADQQSYFSATQLDRTNRTNATPPITDTDYFLTGPPTNTSPAKPGLIAELCIPEDVEGARRVLSGVVNGLKELPRYSKVDLLSDDLRRNLVDPKVILPERHFALAVDFAATEFQPPAGRRHRNGDSSASPKFSRRADEKENGP